MGTRELNPDATTEKVLFKVNYTCIGVFFSFYRFLFNLAVIQTSQNHK